MAFNVDVVVRSADQTGEGVIWCERTKTLWWLDVRRAAIQSYHLPTAKHFVQELPGELLPASLMFRERGGLIMGTASGYVLYEDGQTSILSNPEDGHEGMRMNDGRSDRTGRIWCGSMHETRREKIGTLFSLETSGASRAHVPELDIPNGVNWSPDDRIMYFSDAPRKLIYCADFDLSDGVLRNTRVFADLTQSVGWPDGAAVDEEGCYWSAQFLGGKVIRFSPKGEILQELRLPATLVTCCAFGGDNLDTLFITTGSKRLSDAERKEQPLAGSLFAAHVGVKGFPEQRYKG